MQVEDLEAQVSVAPGGRDLPLSRIAPSKGWHLVDLREVWRYRELLYFLTLRDIKVRYKQTLLGVAWVVLQPLAMLLIYSLIFGRLAGIPSDGAAYPLFAFTGMLPWVLFSRGLTESTSSLLTNQTLITRVYFPRVMVPTATILSAVFDFAVTGVVLAVLLLIYGVAPSQNVFWVPLFVLLLVVAALGVGLWLSALNLEFRDVRFLVGFIVQFWLFATPVIYPSSLIPEGWRTLYSINPMVGVIDGFRWSVLGTGPSPGLELAISASVAVLGLISGLAFFKWRERTFVDAVGSGGR